MMRRMACCLVLVITATGCHRPEDYLLGPSRADQVLTRDVVLVDHGGGRDLAGDGHRSARSAHRRRQAERDVHHDRRHAHRRRQGKPVDHGSGRHQRQGRRRVAELHHSGNGPARSDGGPRSPAPRRSSSWRSRGNKCSTRPSAARRFRRMASRRPSSRSHSSALGRFSSERSASRPPRGRSSRAGRRTRVRDADGRRDGTSHRGASSEKTIGTARVRVTALEVPHEFDIAFTPVDPAQVIRVAAAPPRAPPMA